MSSANQKEKRLKDKKYVRRSITDLDLTTGDSVPFLPYFNQLQVWTDLTDCLDCLTGKVDKKEDSLLFASLSKLSNWNQYYQIRFWESQSWTTEILTTWHYFELITWADLVWCLYWLSVPILFFCALLQRQSLNRKEGDSKSQAINHLLIGNLKGKNYYRCFRHIFMNWLDWQLQKS